ncbi:MAG: murein biosynthesis integral membrane protein MurJ [Leptospirales bacterium]|nr:murein biosynthesis integral membrane protein MurJ [Leptospirales bacterium]
MSRTARNSLKLSFFTMVSRLLGVVRDHFQGTLFGIGAISDSWLVAYQLPNMLRNLLAEGSLQQAFVPVYTDALVESAERARRAAGAIFVFLFFLLAIFCAAGIVAMPLIIPLLTNKPGASGELTVYLSQVMFPFLLTASLTAVLAGISNAHGRFSAPALSPILLNIVFIAGFLYLRTLSLPLEDKVRRLAWITLCGGGLQFLLQAGYVSACGDWPAMRLALSDPALKRIFTLMAPAALGASFFQLNQLTDVVIAHYLMPPDSGGFSALRYAQNLIQLPTGVIGVALSTAILPVLARGARDASVDSSAEIQGALSFSLFLTVPSALAMFLLGPPIINLIYFGGAWNQGDTQAAWLALQFYVLGIPFFSANKILTAAFYARQDTRTPVRILFGTVALNLALNLLLTPHLQQGGIALSSALSSMANTATLSIILRRRQVVAGGRDLLSFLWRAALCWLLFAVAVYAVRELAIDQIRDLSLWFAARFGGGVNGPRYEGLAVFAASALCGGLAYLLASWLLQLKEIRVFTGLLRRRKKG